MQLKVINLENSKKLGTVNLDPSIFSIEPRVDLISEVVRWQLAGRQSGSHQAKNRSLVHGTTKKAYKQKGTGRARRGAWTTNICRGGGVVFGPVVRSHSFKLNKKIRQMALKSVLSLKVKEGNFVVIENLDVATKTKDVALKLSKLGISSALFVVENNLASSLPKAIMNLPLIDLMTVNGLNTYDIMRKQKLALTKGALEFMQTKLGGSSQC